MAWGRRNPGFVDGAALEDDGQHVTGIEKDVQPHKGLDKPVDKTAFGGHENAHHLEQDCELGGQDCRRIENSIDIKQLGQPLAPLTKASSIFW